jgi:hypothetical protein
MLRQRDVAVPSPSMQAPGGAVVVDDFDMDLDVGDGSSVVSRSGLHTSQGMQRHCKCMCTTCEAVSSKYRGSSSLVSADAGPLRTVATHYGLRSQQC